MNYPAEDATNFECPPHKKRCFFLWRRGLFFCLQLIISTLVLFIYFCGCIPCCQPCLLEKLDPSQDVSLTPPGRFSPSTQNLNFIIYHSCLPLISPSLYCCLLTALDLRFPSFSCQIITLYSAPVIYPAVQSAPVWTPSKQNPYSPTFLHHPLTPATPATPVSPASFSCLSSLFLWLYVSLSSGVGPVYPQQTSAVDVSCYRSQNQAQASGSLSKLEQGMLI